MAKSIIVHQYKAHEKTWVLPYNPRHSLKATKVLNKAGISIKHKAQVIGDKVLVHLKSPAVGEIQLYVADKVSFMENIMAIWRGLTSLLSDLWQSLRGTKG